jgi:hypothetical protein
VYATLGLFMSWAAARVFPLRFSLSPLVLSTGPVAALTGGLVMYTILGGGHALLTLPTAVITSAAILSLLASPSKAGRHAKIRSAT